MPHPDAYGSPAEIGDEAKRINADKQRQMLNIFPFRFRLQSVPQELVHAIANIDPYNRIRELSEKHSKLKVEFITKLS